MGEEQGEFCLQEDLEPVTTPEKAICLLWGGKWEVFLTCLSQAILPVHIVWVELELNCLPDKLVYIARFGREDFVVLEFCVVVWAECASGVPLLRSWWFDQSVLCTHGHTDRGYCTYLVSSTPGCPSQDGGSWRSSLAAGQHSCSCVWPPFCWGSCMLSGHMAGECLRWACICWRMYLFSLKVVLRNSNPLWRLSLSHRALALCANVAKMACLLEGWWCDLGWVEVCVGMFLIGLMA